MRTLVIDCATEACSIAVFEDGHLLDHWHSLIGRGHAEHLVPAIAALPDKGRAARILVSLGPGSFTGVRIGLAAARALGLAWRAEVRGYPTLALIAAMARAGHGEVPVTVCTAGGHGEWFVQDYDTGGLPEDSLVSLAPTVASRRAAHPLIAGSRATQMAGVCGHALDVLPDARCALLVPVALLVTELAPIYGRAPDARLPQAVPVP
ncbi:MAG: tRNA (adenosine(37)-N6)-threonylcarbamoyltransferase complex dimerization subunit type 1 TsaB [Alteraurantiacibacter sp.]